jgi:hypothetical protein
MDKVKETQMDIKKARATGSGYTITAVLIGQLLAICLLAYFNPVRFGLWDSYFDDFPVIAAILSQVNLDFLTAIIGSLACGLYFGKQAGVSILIRRRNARWVGIKTILAIWFCTLLLVGCMYLLEVNFVSYNASFPKLHSFLHTLINFIFLPGVIPAVLLGMWAGIRIKHHIPHYTLWIHKTATSIHKYRYPLLVLLAMVVVQTVTYYCFSYSQVKHVLLRDLKGSARGDSLFVADLFHPTCLSYLGEYYDYPMSSREADIKKKFRCKSVLFMSQLKGDYSSYYQLNSLYSIDIWRIPEEPFTIGVDEFFRNGDSISYRQADYFWLLGTWVRRKEWQENYPQLPVRNIQRILR